MQRALDEAGQAASQGLYPKPLGMAHHGCAGERHLTFAGGAEYD